MTALLTGIGIGVGIGIAIIVVIPVAAVVLFGLACFTQDMGIWRPAPKEFKDP